MFSFFKRKKRIHLQGWEKELFEKIFSLLGSEYNVFEKQISEGIIENVRFDEDFPDFISFKLNVALLNKYEKKKEPHFKIAGIEIYDNTTFQYKKINIEICYNLVMGYTMQDILNFNPDIEKIKINSVRKIFIENEEFSSIKSIFTKEELSLINSTDVYQVELDGNIYYHLKDLEDGDFLAVDINKKIFIITHDPYEITLQDVDLSKLL